MAVAVWIVSWVRFVRGTRGVAEDAGPPVHFGPETNLLWKTAVPSGISAPIVWGNHLFLTAQEQQRLVTLACDARTGREFWRQVAPAFAPRNISGRGAGYFADFMAELEP
jgi:hypothetical protein